MILWSILVRVHTQQKYRLLQLLLSKYTENNHAVFKYENINKYRRYFLRVLFTEELLIHPICICHKNWYISRGGSRATATSKMEHFVIIVNGWNPLTIITKCFISNVAAALDPPLIILFVLFVSSDLEFLENEVFVIKYSITHLSNFLFYCHY